MNKATSTNCNFSIVDLKVLKQKVLNWANRFSTFCFLDNHHYQIEPHTQECLLAVGRNKFIESKAGEALEKLDRFISPGGDFRPRWLFGHLGFDLKNEIEHLHSNHDDHIQFPDLFFSQPEILIRWNEKEMTIESSQRGAEEIFESIMQADEKIRITKPVTLQNKITRTEYISVIRELQKHLLRGDCYEINFCQEFFAEDVMIDPVNVYQKLAAVSPNPFSALYKLEDKWLICASPERFLKKTGNRILSQPIKGTARRNENAGIDRQSEGELRSSAKERSENVMVVDLVRNDLSRICVEGSVKVDELFGIYSFPQVHQMISTVSGQLRPDLSFANIIRATFPMGSMTGAPKKKVLELIEQYEKTKRGIFSGAVGYIDPSGDFDFNVVIRSITYNEANKYLSFQTGSGITFYSEPEKEWEECLLKAEAMKKVLEEI